MMLKRSRYRALVCFAAMKNWGPTEPPSPLLRAMLWAIATGVLFTALNVILRKLSQEMSPYMVQFLRYGIGLAVMVPWILASGFAAYRPNGLGGQLARGVVHTVGLATWYTALPHLPLADSTAISFTIPIFAMIGAAWFLGERMVPARWIAAIVGLAGVFILLAPNLGGTGGIYNLVMLASQPLFAASLLITKLLTRRDRAEVIVVWQAITIALFTLPIALFDWRWPSLVQWGWFVVAAMLGNAGQYCSARSLMAAEVSATQSVRFLELIWAAGLGILIFGDPVSQWTIFGGLVILAATVWISRREARQPVRLPP
jgi:drug/metabolite transporter (DMT)-like permease